MKRPSMGLTTVGITISLLVALCFTTTTPPVEAQYMRIQILPSSFSTSWLGTNTNLLEVRFAENDGTHIYTATGETFLNIPENNTLSAIGAYFTLDDNYASSIALADTWTRVTVTLRDDDNVTQYDNVLEAGAPTSTVDNGTYYTCYAFEAGLTINLTPGTWLLDAEYEIFTTPP